MKLPSKTRGREISSHMANSATNVPNGRAEDDASAQTNKLRIKTVRKTLPGTKSAVINPFLTHWDPPNVL